MTNYHPLTGNEHSLGRAIQLCKVGQLNLCILFPDTTSAPQKFAVQTFVKQYCNLTSIYEGDIVVEYCNPSADDFQNESNARWLAKYLDNQECLDEVNKIPSTLENSGETLLKTAYERLGLEQMDVEKIINIAKVSAFVGESDVIKIEHLAEAIHYRAFDRTLLVEKSWTANEILDILNNQMEWTDECAAKHIVGDFDDLPSDLQNQYEGMMWGWQDAVQKLKTILNNDIK